MQDRRAAIDRLLALAKTVLEAGGHAASKSTVRKIQASLEALAGHGRDLPTPGPGRLERELQPAGFDTLAAFGLPAAAQAPVDEGETLRAALQEAVATRRRAREEATAAADRARDAEAIAVRARADLAAAEAAVAELERKLAALDVNTR
jgi:hypothetical protein